MTDFSGKTVIVTGGGKGVGFGISQAFLKAGANVVICGRRQPEQVEHLTLETARHRFGSVQHEREVVARSVRLREVDRQITGERRDDARPRHPADLRQLERAAGIGVHGPVRRKREVEHVVEPRPE